MLVKLVQCANHVCLDAFADGVGSDVIVEEGVGQRVHSKDLGGAVVVLVLHQGEQHVDHRKDHLLFCPVQGVVREVAHRDGCDAPNACHKHAFVLGLVVCADNYLGQLWQNIYFKKRSFKQCDMSVMIVKIRW